MTTREAEASAREANSVERWDALWAEEGQDTWRQHALREVYDRIVHLVPTGLPVVDVGGGVGVLAQSLVAAGKGPVQVLDHSPAALAAAVQHGGVTGQLVDLEQDGVAGRIRAPVVTATEVLEHLSDARRREILAEAERTATHAFFSVPNDCLGPDVEPQHTIQFTAMSFKRLLQEYFSSVRVEVHGRYLLGVCGAAADKGFTLSMCMPVRDEAADIERTLVSFRGVADEIVVGVDPRTVDNTWEIAEKYADTVFFLEDPRCVEPESLRRMKLSAPEKVPENGVHFSWARNQCMDKCTSDWIFMTEGHESLKEGQDTLLHLDKIVPAESRVCMVWRSGQGMRWAFPWLCRNDPDLRYERSTHNELAYPRKTLATKLVGVVTDHFRDHARSKARAEQRRAQNRRTLMDDWHTKKNEQSLFYLGGEWRGIDPVRAVDRLKQFIEVSNNGAHKYQARLILAKELYRLGKKAEAEVVLLGCTADDWNRTEHWLWLGDLYYEADAFERALQFYRYAATRINDPPFSVWWIAMDNYTYLPAQRMAVATASVGKLQEACLWAQKAAELLPSDTPEEVRQEAQKNIELLQEALDGSGPN